MRLALALLLVPLATSCQRPPPANPHYVLGAPYQAGGVWYYPRESYEGVETGLATVYGSGHADLTTDGEVFDQSALAAAHQTLQLPAIARVTNLENGLQVVVRINDRGPATPHRLLEVTSRTATLLQFARDTPTRVRLEVLPGESRAAADAVPGAPKLDLAAAPIGAVQQSDLGPPGSVALAGAPRAATAASAPAVAADAPGLRLPEVLTQGYPQPGQLFIRLGTFHNYQYANMQRARVGGLGAAIVSSGSGRIQTHQVIVGPLANVPQADIVLDQVLRSGVTDARIVVE
ncbi:MAG: RlpA-like double-psi beta-barrel domain-containing protein [Acetobacteraceae bacterium]